MHTEDWHSRPYRFYLSGHDRRRPIYDVTVGVTNEERIGRIMPSVRGLLCDERGWLICGDTEQHDSMLDAAESLHRRWQAKMGVVAA